MMWKTVVSLSFYIQIGYAVHVRKAVTQAHPVDYGPSLWVAILSKRTDLDRRQKVRRMWQDGADAWHKKGWGKLEYKFVLASASEGETPQITKDLKEEREYGDIIIQNFYEEGYQKGILTMKVLASMKNFLDSTNALDLFMKVDDDTFVEFSRLRGVLRNYMVKGGNISTAFMGVFPRENATLAYHRGIPCRDPMSMWYEPKRNFLGDSYPVSPQGGPGYIVSREMVSMIVNDGIAEEHLLYNEDKAVGYWVDLLIQKGFTVDFVDIPGTNGYDGLETFFEGPMRQYPFVLHHHLDGKTIDCLHRVAVRPDSLRATVKQCNYGTTVFTNVDAICRDALWTKHDLIIEGWSETQWERDAYGDQVPIQGTSQILEQIVMRKNSLLGSSTHS